MPRQYPAAFRQALVDRMLAGETDLSLAPGSGFSEQTLHWARRGCRLVRAPSPAGRVPTYQ